jgi:hypothetical protein
LSQQIFVFAGRAFPLAKAVRREFREFERSFLGAGPELPGRPTAQTASNALHWSGQHQVTSAIQACLQAFGTFVANPCSIRQATNYTNVFLWCRGWALNVGLLCSGSGFAMPRGTKLTGRKRKKSPSASCGQDGQENSSSGSGSHGNSSNGGGTIASTALVDAVAAEAAKLGARQRQNRARRRSSSSGGAKDPDKAAAKKRAAQQQRQTLTVKAAVVSAASGTTQLSLKAAVRAVRDRGRFDDLDISSSDSGDSDADIKRQNSGDSDNNQSDIDTSNASETAATAAAGDTVGQQIRDRISKFTQFKTGSFLTQYVHRCVSCAVAQSPSITLA